MLRSVVAVVLAAAFLANLPVPASAQQGQDYFIPGQQKPAGQPRPAAPRPPPHPSEAGGPPMGMMPQPGEQEPPPPPPAASDLPPPPELPPLAKGEPPPAAVIGVLGVPDVMRASTAAQAVEKAIGERRNKLNEDAQKEQMVWRDMQQSLANDRTKLSPDQIRGRERDLQERITNAQRQFRDRNRVIQEAAQYALAQIERTLVSVIRQVAEARSMNLVLHRSQVALNVNPLDITEQVTQQLNKVLPSVLIPPDGVSPAAMVAAAKKEAAKLAPATAGKPPATAPEKSGLPAAGPAAPAQ